MGLKFWRVTESGGGTNLCDVNYLAHGKIQWDT
jgi:hypothetical protein